MKISLGDFRQLTRACLALRRGAFLGFGSVTAVFTGKEMRATDGRVGVEIPCEMPESFAVPVENFFEPFDHPTEEEFLCTVLDDKVQVAQGRFRGVVPRVSPDTTPTWPRVPSTTWVPLEGTSFWKMANEIVFAASPKVSALNGVGVYKESLVVGDGIRGVYAPLTGLGSLEGFVPQAMLAYVDKAFVLPQAPEAILFEEHRVWLRLAAGVLVWALLPEGPLTQKIFDAMMRLLSQSAGIGPSGVAPWVEWDRLSAQEAAARVAYFAGESMAFEAVETGLRFAAESVRGSAEEIIPAEVHQTFAMRMNPSVLVDAAGRTASCALTSDRRAVVFHGEGYDYAVMGMVR